MKVELLLNLQGLVLAIQWFTFPTSAIMWFIFSRE